MSEEQASPPPAILEVYRKIGALLEEHDLVGAFVLCDQQGSVHGLKISATWSSARLVDGIGAAKKIDFMTLDRAKAQATGLAIQKMRDLFTAWAPALNDMLGEIEKNERAIGGSFRRPQ